MSDRLVQVMMSGPDEGTFWPAVGLPIPHASHFLVTDFYASCGRFSDLLDIGANPSLTHMRTGKRVSDRLESVDQASKIAVVLEFLPIPWDGTEGEMRASLIALPPALRRWLREEVCGFPPRKTELR